MVDISDEFKILHHEDAEEHDSISKNLEWFGVKIELNN